jgi:hypothetical protein
VPEVTEEFTLDAICVLFSTASDSFLSITMRMAKFRAQLGSDIQALLDAFERKMPLF